LGPCYDDVWGSGSIVTRIINFGTKRRYRDGIARSVLRLAVGCTAGVQFPAGASDFSLLHSDHTGCGAHPASYAVDASGSFLGVKQSVREADHSPPSAAEVKDGGAIPPLPQYVTGTNLPFNRWR
jgi:hypothetical protein